MIDKRMRFSAVVLTLGLAASGCATTSSGEPNQATQGALLGSLAGAGLGAIIGHQSGETGEGAAIGAGVGALGGYIFGNEQDKTQLQTETANAQQSANAALQSANTLVINVKNSNGSITPVTVHRNGNLYQGPKGEIYTQLPTEDQLRPVYGF